MSTQNVGKGQFYGTDSSGRVSPLRSSGRPHALTSEQVDELVANICRSRETRRMTFLELSMNFPHWGAGQYTIGSALKRKGYQRRRSRYKPPLLEAVRAQRLSWAQQHVNWTLDEWFSISWTDETYVNDDSVMCQYVTRLVSEEYNSTCTVDRIRKNNSYMFWGSFAGTQAGPFVFWEKAWGKMTA
ncbi:hypothetical protein K3495_g14807 [Podosphaera aphanis]|nr:hypothetical protein K3495_g14807 [Podosphaera aphanis]